MHITSSSVTNNWWKVEFSGKQMLIQRLVHRIFTRKCPWDQCLWERVGECRTGQRSGAAIRKPHCVVASANTTKSSGAKMVHPNWLYFCCNVQAFTAQPPSVLGYVSHKEGSHIGQGSSAFEAIPEGLTAEGCLQQQSQKLDKKSFPEGGQGCASLYPSQSLAECQDWRFCLSVANICGKSRTWDHDSFASSPCIYQSPLQLKFKLLGVCDMEYLWFLDMSC